MTILLPLVHSPFPLHSNGQAISLRLCNSSGVNTVDLSVMVTCFVSVESCSVVVVASSGTLLVGATSVSLFDVASSVSLNHSAGSGSVAFFKTSGGIG